MGDGWVLPLTAEELNALGVDGEDGSVLVQVQGGDPSRLIIRRALTFTEAMEETLDCHKEALVRLAALDTDAGGKENA